jgi:tetratricopeptide (TPR) repeat protein
VGTTDISLQRIFKELTEGNVGSAIAEAETYLAAWPNPQTAEKLNTLKDDYRLMADYWLRGVKDPHLAEQYQRLLQRLYVLCANISIYRHMSGSSYLHALYSNVRQQGMQWSMKSIRQEMENFVTDVAMLQLEPEHLREERQMALYKQHQQQMNQLFNYVLTSHVWTAGIGQDMQDLLLSPTVDSNDQQLIVSAVMLSLMNRFDMVKFRLLVDVYRLSQDEHVRQRALVGWALSIDDDYLSVYPEQRELIGSLLQSKKVCRELTELQMQLVYTLDAEKDNKTIQKEIIPDLLKNNQFRITRNGIEEIEEDPLEDVLHPDAAEQRMEKLEASMQRMLDMQRQGVDVYFGGFSQMKRYPFFYDMSNWLVPFFLQHPDITQFLKKSGHAELLEHMLQRVPFCSSDKYSFVIAFQQVVKQLPDSIRQMLLRGEAQLAGMEEMNEEQQHSPAYIRRIYLMDLYRFFRLFPNRTALCNPFDTSKNELGQCLFFTSELFRSTPLEYSKREVTAMLRKRRLTYSADLLLDTFAEDMHDVQYYLWQQDYEAALLLDPDNERALAGRARVNFHNGMYEDAQDDYERLLLLFPDKMGYMLNRAVCLLHLEEYEDALKLLYQLNYEHADDVNVQRVLAWTLTCAGKPEQAERYYVQLANNRQATGEDYMNYANCLWLLGKLREAADNFARYFECEQDAGENVSTAFNREWLHAHGISDIDIKMMQALVFSKNNLGN